MGLIRPAQEPRRHIPALTVVGDDRDGLPIVASQQAHDAAVAIRLKGDAIADLEFEHLGVRPHLSQELEPGNDSVVQVNQFRLGQLVDVDPHAHPAHRVAPPGTRSLSPASRTPIPSLRRRPVLLTTSRRPGATGSRLFDTPEPRAGATVTPAMPGPLPDPRSVCDAIAREESRLLHLQTDLGHAQARLAELKATLAAHEGAVQTSPPAPSTALEKIALFRARFRGRDDIYPRFWSNARTGRKGYAPACQNEWIKG